MRVLIQRVSSASVTIEKHRISEIGAGLLLLIGIEERDSAEDIDWLVPKILKMRIFEDEGGKMNRSLIDCGGEVLVVSQFTLHASTKKGNRPSFIKAARPEQSEPLYLEFCAEMSRSLNRAVKTGQFGAEMQVALENSGPVTIWIDSRDRE